MNKNLSFIFKYKKIYKVFLYFLIFIVIIFFSYFSIPKFFNYTPELIKKSLKSYSDINIKNILNINYRSFPSPRLRVYGSSLELKENALKVEGAEVDIILNPLNLINYKKLNYDRLLINGGSTNIKINNVNELLNYIKKSKKKINFKKNNIIILQKNKKLFEIENSHIKFSPKKNIQQLKINGSLLNYKVIFSLKNQSENKVNINLKIPELDISTNISSDIKNTFGIHEGSVNLVVLNNFFQFNFVKEKKFMINKGFIRNNLISSTFEGEASFKPHFFFNLDVEPSTINIEKIFSKIQKNFFSENPQRLTIIKKINGFLNFKNIFEGNVIFKNSEILFQNFKTLNDTPILFDVKISKFGKKGKIQFNLFKDIKYKQNSAKELKISGFIIPSSSKVIFEKILLDKEIFTFIKMKNYEEKLKNEVINNSLSNIFNEKKINNFLKDFVN